MLGRQTVVVAGATATATATATASSIKKNKNKGGKKLVSKLLFAFVPPLLLSIARIFTEQPLENVSVLLFPPVLALTPHPVVGGAIPPSPTIRNPNRHIQYLNTRWKGLEDRLTILRSLKYLEEYHNATVHLIGGRYGARLHFDPMHSPKNV
jgi:hypothetical protein